jgi:two-component system, sensor histidine kinase and response regulator
MKSHRNPCHAFNDNSRIGKNSKDGDPRIMSAQFHTSERISPVHRARPWNFRSAMSALCLSVLVAEWAIMVVFQSLQLEDSMLANIIDASLLVLLITPVFSSVIRQMLDRESRLIETQGKLAESQVLLQTVLHTASNGILIVNDQGVVTLSNPSAERIFANNSGSLVGRRAVDVFPRELAEKCVPRAIGSGSATDQKLFSDRIDITLNNGRELSVDAEAHMFRSSGRDYYSCMLQDVTEIKQTLTKVEAARLERDRNFENLAAVCNNIDVGVVLVDADYQVRLINNAYCNLWNIKRPSLAEPTTLESLFTLSQDLKRSDGENADWQFFAENVLEKEGSGHGQVLERPDGQSVLYRFTRLLNGDRLLTYFDITETAKRQKLLEEARISADAANRAKSDFLANMSHELRTPMNGVIGMASLLIDTKLDEDQRLYAETISKSGDSLLTLLNDILDLSKIESGKFEIDFTPFELSKVAEEVMQVMVPRANENGVELVLRYNPELPTCVIGDGSRVRQVLTNLVGNAVKFTERGHILLDLDGTVVGSDIDLTIRVQDTGIGIPSDKVDKIFAKFEQVDASSNRKYSGSGLGLTICRQLIELMAGSIKVESEMGKGTTFSIFMKLPLGVQVNDTTAAHAKFDGARILIVDDNAVNRLVLKERLESWKVNVTSSCDGAEALALLDNEAAANRRFDAIILDYNMPNMDGVELAGVIQSLAYWKTTPMVLLSSSMTQLSAVDLRKIGVESTMMKPFRASNLFNSLAAIFSKTGGSYLHLEKQDIAKQNFGLKSGRSLKILIADDNRANRLVVKSMLNLPGLDLHFAVDGQDAFEKFGTLNPDIVLMDVSMPVTDGFQSTAMIRQYERDFGCDRTPVIALTANALRGDQEACISAGMDDYLTKPIVRTVLVKAIDRWRTKLESNAMTNAIRREPNSDEIRLDNSAHFEAVLPASPTLHSPDNNLNFDRLETLATDIGTDDLAEIVSEFILECERAIVELSDTLSDKDDQRMREILHLIRGCAANLGVDSLVSLTEQARLALLDRKEINSSDVRLFSTALTSADVSFKNWLGGKSAQRVS